MRLRWGLVASRENVGSVGVTHVAAPVRSSNEPDPGTALASCADVSLKVVTQIGNPDVQKLGKLLLDHAGQFSFDHSHSEPHRSAITGCPLEVRLDGGGVVLLVPSERLGVLLEPSVAFALGERVLQRDRDAVEAGGEQRGFLAQLHGEAVAGPQTRAAAKSCASGLASVVVETSTCQPACAQIERSTSRRAYCSSRGSLMVRS